MAKKIVMTSLTSAADLITSRDQVRTGFIAMALEKNYLATPYIEEAKALKVIAKKVKSPKDLLSHKEIFAGLLTASGLSDKSLKFLTEEDKLVAINGLIKEFLEPAGKNYADELVYRYLLIKGDALGGKARNLAGVIGERKFIRKILSVLNLSGINYKWRDAKTGLWREKSDSDEGIEKNINAIAWTQKSKSRLLVFNNSVPLVKKNVDICLSEGGVEQLKKGKDSIIHLHEKFLLLGELKAGIDPAGADEHWKTAGSALIRIRNAFDAQKRKPDTFFVGAAIEPNMANEIFRDVQQGILTHAANLNNDEQLTELCSWIINK